MSYDITDFFTPVTVASPAIMGIKEFLPCEELKPYVRCFWEYGSLSGIKRVRIIPDCCADIIVPLDMGRSVFVGASDNAFVSGNIDRIFGIRFYAWAVPYFINDTPNGLFNADILAAEIFPHFDSIEEQIVAARSSTKRVELCENYLKGIINKRFQSPDVLNGLYYAAVNNCSVSVKDISDHCVIGRRNLERKFYDHLGIAPKHMISLMRYQMLWKDCVKSDFNGLDCVEKYGFYDCAHMYGFFKKYHGISIPEAKKELHELSHFYNT